MRVGLTIFVMLSMAFGFVSSLYRATKKEDPFIDVLVTLVIFGLFGTVDWYLGLFAAIGWKP